MSKTSLILSISPYDDHSRILKVSSEQTKNVLEGIFILCARALRCLGWKALPVTASL